MKQARIALASAAALLLLAPMIAGLLGVEPRPIENRRLQKWPGLDSQGWLEPRSFEAVTAWLLDHLPLRDKAVAVHAWISVHTFRDSPSPKVHLGRDGWLFYDLSFTRACSGTDTPLQIAKRLRRASRIIEGSGRRVIVTIVPDKNAVYPEKLGGAAPFARCTSEKRQALRTALATHTPSGYEDMFAALEELKRSVAAGGSKADEWLYIPTDTHWTTFAAARMVEAIVERVDPTLWGSAALKPERVGRHNGDLTRMMGLREPVEVTHYAIEREGVVARSRPADEGRLPGMRIYGAQGEQPGQVAPLRVLFLHDSFMYPAIDMLPGFFEESAFSHWQTSAHPQALFDEIREADVVVMQIAERGTYNWLHKVLPNLVLNQLAAASRSW